jgi:hypothetical protein
MSVRAAVYFAFAAAVALLAHPGDTGDLPFFVHTAEKLFSSGWADLFADPSVQVGPLQLLFFRLGDLAGVLALVVQLGCAALLWVVAGRLLAGRDPRAQLAVGIVAVSLGLTYSAYQDGHPAQFAIPLLWVLAGLDAREGRTVRAGLIVGLSAGLEVWGVLGAVVFVLAPHVRAAMKGLAAEALVGTALFLPFVLAGEFRMFDYRWRVNGDTLLGLVIAHGTAFTWPMRLLQGGCAIAVGAGIAWPLRRTSHAIWLAPLGVVATRVALDPVRYPWYWLSIEMLVLLGGAELLTSSVVERHRPRMQGSSGTWKSQRNPLRPPRSRSLFGGRSRAS